MQDGLVIVAIGGTLRVEILKNGGNILLVKDFRRNKIFLFDKPDEHQACDKANDAGVDILTVVILSVHITWEGNTCFRRHRPLIPFEQVVVELFGEQFGVEHFLPFLIQFVKGGTVATLHPLKNIQVTTMGFLAVDITQKADFPQFLTLSLTPLLFEFGAFAGTDAQMLPLAEDDSHGKVEYQTVECTC